jgi:hypothetical protein
MKTLETAGDREAKRNNKPSYKSGIHPSPTIPESHPARIAKVTPGFAG